VFESTDPERTEEFLATAFGAPMKINGSRDNYHFRIARVGSGSLQITTVDQTLTGEAAAHPLPDHLAVLRMHRGVRTNVDLDDRLGPGDLSLHAQPSEPVRVRIASARYNAVFIPTQAVLDAAHNRPDDPLDQLRFRSLRPADRSAARRWQHTVDYITHSVLANPEPMTQPLLVSAATNLLAAALLTTFPNTWTSETHHQDRVDATATTLTRAVAFIEDNADLDIGLVDIARAAYVTVRAVQLAFRRNLDTSPMAYLRRVRLERAHEQLRAGHPHDGTIISHVAARWGFADPSRFTALYRHTYGQLPSHTLRQ
jgi:AraC-like DNA-binding protein